MTEAVARRPKRRGIDAVCLTVTVPSWVRTYIRTTVDESAPRTGYSALTTDLIVAGIQATDPSAVPEEQAS